MTDLIRSPHQDRALSSRPLAGDRRPWPDRDAPDLRHLVRVLIRRRTLIGLIAAGVVAPALVGTLLAVPRYRSAVLIQIDPEPVQILPYRDLDRPMPQYDMFMKTQEHVLRGQTLQARVATQLRSRAEASGLQAESSQLGRHVEVQRLENTQIFRLSYLAPTPETAAQVANTFAEEYIKLQFQTHQQTREGARRLLEKELVSLESRVQLSEQQLVDYARDNNMQFTDGDRSSLAQDKLALLARQVIDAEAELVTAQARLGTLQTSSVKDFPEKLVTGVIGDRQTTLLKLEHELTSLRASFGENWPAVVQKRSEIALVRDQLEREKVAVLSQAREQALLEYRGAERKRQMLAAARTEQEQLVNKLQDASIQYNILRREVETNQKLYEGLLERLRQTGVAPGMEFGNIRVVEPAVPDSTVASPNLRWNVFLASVLGLALGICVAFTRDYWDSSLSTVEEVEQITMLPVLASVPLIQSRPRRRGLGSGRGALKLFPRTERGSPLDPEEQVPASTGVPRVDLLASIDSAEAVRDLCASILLSQSERPPRRLVVTSAGPGEGKTTLTVQLGRALAESGARTLVVECDLRRPTFGNEFGIGSEGGLSLLLTGHIPRAQIHGTDNDKLFVVGAGPVAPNPVALLNSRTMDAFLEEMSSSFHFVIMDTPPVFPMADARVLGAKADGVVLVVRAGFTPQRLVRRVCSLLDMSGVTILGAVLNGVDARDSDSAYRRYYKHYEQT